MRKNKVLITGCSGFIGFHFSKFLLERNFEVYGLDSLNDYYDQNLKKSRLRNLHEFEKFSFKKLNISNFKKLSDFVENINPGIIINLAAQAGVRYSKINPVSYIESNISGFSNLLLSAKNVKAKLIYASSSSVYGESKNIPFKEDEKFLEPLSLYGISKKYNELISKNFYDQFGFKSIGLRFFTVYGSWGRPDMAYYKFSEALKKDKKIIVFNEGNMSRDMTHISDICNGIYLSMKFKTQKNEIFNLGNSSPVKVSHLIRHLEKHFRKKAKISYKKSTDEIKKTYADLTKSKKYLGYNPKIKFEEGMKEFLDWFDEYNLR